MQPYLHLAPFLLGRLQKTRSAGVMGAGVGSQMFITVLTQVDGECQVVDMVYLNKFKKTASINGIPVFLSLCIEQI